MGKAKMMMKTIKGKNGDITIDYFVADQDFADSLNKTLELLQAVKYSYDRDGGVAKDYAKEKIDLVLDELDYLIKKL